MRMIEGSGPYLGEAFIQSFGVLMISGTRDDGQTIQCTVCPFAQEELLIIGITAIQEVSDLHNGIDIGYPCSERIEVRPHQMTMDIA